MPFSSRGDTFLAMSRATRVDSLAAAASVSEIITRARGIAATLDAELPLRFFAERASGILEIEPPPSEAPSALLALVERARAEGEVLGAGHVVLTLEDADVMAVAMPVGLAASAAGGLLHDAIVLALRAQREALVSALSVESLELSDSVDLAVVSAVLARIVAGSRAMRRPVALLARVAPSDVSVLLTGESGTGKEVFARALHDASTRADGPFVALNCAAIPATLFEAELFGYRRGAFSGAVRDHAGVARRAEGGTLLLDEVGELSPDAQAKLLRFLDDRRVQALGEDHLVEVDLRVLSATNRDLAEEVSAGRFREDLYYRLNVVEIALPPLRQRRDDIEPLARHLLERNEVDARRLAPETSDLLRRCLWPGNVRQLDNELRRATALAGRGRIEPRHLSRKLREADKAPANSYAERVDAFKRELIGEALADCEGNQSAAARQLDISRQHFRQLMEKLSVKR